MRDHIEKARQEYLSKLDEDGRKKYLEKASKARAQKIRKNQKIEMVHNYLRSLAVGDPNNPDDRAKTAARIRDALVQEGVTSGRVLKAAMKVLYPQLRKKDDENVKRELRMYNFAGMRKPPKATSAIGYTKTFGKLTADEIESARKELEARLKLVPPTTETVITGPPPTSTETEAKKSRTIWS
jgi:hypothetical protein